MDIMGINEIWSRIGSHAGEVFYTKKGRPFTYHIRNNYICLENTNRTIPQSQVEQALHIHSNIVSDYKQFQGSAYLFGLLHDSRII